MSKKAGVFFVSFLVIILSMHLVPAPGSLDDIITTTGDGLNTVYDSIITPLAKFLIGGDAATGENGSKNFFTLILLFILLFSILWEITDRISILNSNNWIQFIVSLAVSVISIRFLGAADNMAWFQTVLLPTQSLGIAILCMLPLIFWVVFVQDIGANKPVLRKILYVFAGVLFLVLYFSRYDELSTGSSGFFANPSTVYFYAALLAFALLLLDGTIRRLWSRSWAESHLAAYDRKAARQILRDMDQLEADRTATPPRISEAEYRRERADLQRRYNELASH